MPSKYEQFDVKEHGGFDRSVEPHLLVPGQYYELMGLRPWRKSLHQVPLLEKCWPAGDNPDLTPQITINLELTYSLNFDGNIHAGSLSLTTSANLGDTLNGSSNFVTDSDTFTGTSSLGDDFTIYPLARLFEGGEYQFIRIGTKYYLYTDQVPLNRKFGQVQLSGSIDEGDPGGAESYSWNQFLSADQFVEVLHGEALTITKTNYSNNLAGKKHENLFSMEASLTANVSLSNVTVNPFNDQTNTPKLLRPVRRNNVQEYLLIGHKEARLISEDFSTNTALPTIYQTTVPETELETTQCLLYNLNTTTVADNFPNDEDFLAVDIINPTTCRVTINNQRLGVFPIAPEITLGVTGLKLSFYTNTGFKIGDRWIWTRQDQPKDSFEAFNRPQLSTANYADDLYIGDVDGRVMRYRKGVLDGVGYYPVYGRHVAVFFNHLFVGKTPQDEYLVRWSHLNNPDQFFPTDINEADEKNLYSEAFTDSTVRGITGMEVANNRLYIFLPNTIYTCDYVGLPQVMNIQTLNEGVGCVFDGGLVRGKQGLYFVGRDQFYVLSGGQLTAIGDPVRERFFNELVDDSDFTYNRLYGIHNTFYGEISWVHYCINHLGERQQRVVTYSESTGQWHWHSMPSVWELSTIFPTHCATQMINSQGRMLYGVEGALLREFDVSDGDYANQLPDYGDTVIQPCVLSVDDGETHTIEAGQTEYYPEVTNTKKLIIETGDFLGRAPYRVKSVDTFVLHAEWTKAKSVKVYYSVRDNTATAPVWVEAGEWLTDSTYFRLDKPHAIPFRVLRFKFEILADADDVNAIADVQLKVWGTKIMEDDDVED